MDTTTVIAALLHDVVEDADVAIDEIREASVPRWPGSWTG
jgi:(p)ppGpp synthase/HD superfamily hydrolase